MPHPRSAAPASARVKQVADAGDVRGDRASSSTRCPSGCKLLIVLAAFVGLRQGELLELRRSDVDGVTGRIT